MKQFHYDWKTGNTQSDNSYNLQLALKAVNDVAKLIEDNRRDLEYLERKGEMRKFINEVLAEAVRFTPNLKLRIDYITPLMNASLSAELCLEDTSYLEQVETRLDTAGDTLRSAMRLMGINFYPQGM